MTSPAHLNDVIRRATLKLSPSTVLDSVDSLDLEPGAKISPVLGIPLRSLRQKRDVVAFASHAPIAAVRAVVEIIAAAPLERVVEELGDHADAPSFDQLSSALDRVGATGATTDELVAVLAYAVPEQFPAAAHCERLLSERAEFSLPEMPLTNAPTSLLSPKPLNEEVREQRRLRREAQKSKRSAPPRRAQLPKAPRTTSVVEVAPPAPRVDVVEILRRRVALTPTEAERFDPTSPLAGSVVLVEVPFSAVDPLAPEQSAKERPAVVVAAATDALLVRGVYSNAAPSRVLFTAWRRLQLDHVSYVDHDRVVIELAGSSPARLGQLTDAEWNAIA